MSKKTVKKIGIALAATGSIALSENTSAQIVKDSIELEKRLKNLSLEVKDAPKKEILPNAMCYMPARPKIENYVCPTCSKTTPCNVIDIRNIKSISNIVFKIKELGYDVILDESKFCKHCSSYEEFNYEFNRPSLTFKIRFSKNSDYHHIESNIYNDYNTLYEFFINKSLSKYEYNKEDIKLKVSIIQKMTGLGSDLNIER